MKPFARGVRDWRDAEALATVGSERAKGLLKEALRSRDDSVTIAVLEYAGDLVMPQIGGDANKYLQRLLKTYSHHR